MIILFLHGWHSVPGGVKPTWLKDHGHEVFNPGLDDDDFAAAVAAAQAVYDQHHPDVIVGSSRGGAVAMHIESGETPLVLLCPAWQNWGTASRLKPNAVILHSRSDDVIPFEDSELLMAHSGLPAAALIEVGTDHRLAEPLPLAAMLNACEQHVSASSLLDHPDISGNYLFPQSRRVRGPLFVPVSGARLACHHRVVDPDALTLVHFHGNGEAVADYVPDLADVFAGLGLNSLFVEYRGYGGSSGEAQLAAMLGDGVAVLRAAGVAPERAIALGRSIGSLYAIELAHRLPSLAGLIVESGIADAAERFLAYADFAGAGVDEQAVRREVQRLFNHQRKLAGYRGPLLVLHTEQDGLIDISHAERLLEWSASERKGLVRFREGTHNTILRVNRREYLDEIRCFAEQINF